jgi:hypothetical protein
LTRNDPDWNAPCPNAADAPLYVADPDGGFELMLCARHMKLLDVIGALLLNEGEQN